MPKVVRSKTQAGFNPALPDGQEGTGDGGSITSCYLRGLREACLHLLILEMGLISVPVSIDTKQDPGHGSFFDTPFLIH